MASIQHYLSDTQIVWETFDFAYCENFAVSEIWQATADDHPSTTTLHRRINNQDLYKWLRQTDGSDSTGRRCMLRIAWVHRDTKRRLIGIDKTVFEELRAAFRHGLAHDYIQTQYAGIGRINHSRVDEEVHFLCNHPKLAVTWSQNTGTKATSVICMADRFKLDVLQDLVACQFIQRQAAWMMTPALICSILSSKEVDIEAGDVKRALRHIEVRTGYHEWANRSEGPARGDLVSLAAKLTGGSSRIASNTRKVGVIHEVCQFMKERTGERHITNGTNEILSTLHILEHRTAMQALDLKYIAHRTQVQKEAILHLISTNGSETAQNIAENSRAVALATNSDARSMKALAWLTVFFLPGTLVSGLFSTPLIERNSGHSIGIRIWKVGLLVYIAVSVALIFFVFMTWRLWSLTSSWKIRNRQPVMRKYLNSTSEIEALALRRASTLSENTVLMPQTCQL